MDNDAWSYNKSDGLEERPPFNFEHSVNVLYEHISTQQKLIENQISLLDALEKRWSLLMRDFGSVIESDYDDEYKCVLLKQIYSLWRD